MGDRGNIVVRSAPKQEVFLYTHWCGSDVPRIVQIALRRRQRWSDAAYLARILFDTLTEGDQGNETGYGISTYRCDYEHDDVVVDVAKQTVSYRNPSTGAVTKTRSFAEFCGLSDLQRETERVRQGSRSGLKR